MTGRNPDGTEDSPSPDCSDVAYGPQRLNAIIGAYEAFLDPVCGTDDLSFHLVLELPATETPSARRHPPAPNRMAPEAAWHTLSAEEVLRAEGADPRHGLSSAEAASRAGRFGANALAAGRAEPRWRAFIRQYSDPMQIVLLVVGLLSLFPLRQLGTGLLLILLTLANAVLGLQQEGGLRARSPCSSGG